MKKKISILVLAMILLLNGKLFTQDKSDSIYFQRFYYTCKAWGYVKYFHSAMAECSINWDSVLIHTLPQIQAAGSNQEFNNILYDMVMAPGEMAVPTTPPPIIPDSLIFNLDNSWFNDTSIYDEVRTVLDTIQSRFRPQYNCYVQSFYVGNPDFTNDKGYYQSGSYPSLEIRLLALARYWNDIEYFFPYTDIMDQDWDTTLMEMIPWFYNAQDGTEYALAVLRIVHHINDTHGFTSSNLASQYFGAFYPKFYPLQAEGKMVVAYVDESLGDIYPGDVILQMDGINIEEYKDSIRPFIAASNESRMQSNLNHTIVKGGPGDFSVFIQNENGTHFVTASRVWGSGSYNALSWPTWPVWYDTVLNEGCHYGYVDLGRLGQNSVDNMFEDLWDTDAIIFDIRSYPQGTLWTIVDYIYPEPLYIANFTIPSTTYSGTISWDDEVIGNPNQDLYQGYIIILFNENTLSQAEYTCMGLDLHPKSIKIGSQTAGADGNVSQIFLPGMIISNITGLGLFYPDYTPTQRIGIIPDYEVGRTILGLREQRDDVLKFAMSCDIIGIRNNNLSEIPSTRVYPNPATGNIIIEKGLPGMCSFEIIDFSGRCIKSVESDNKIINLNIDNIPKGIYLLRIRNAERLTINKLVIE